LPTSSDRAVAIRLENVSKRYRLRRQQSLAGSWRDRLLRRDGHDREQDYFWALKDVSFAVQPGQVLGIVGPNGAGKTTILKLLSRITRPTSGKITTNGKLSALIELGAGFHPDLTGRENVYINGVILGLSRDEIRRRFDEIVAFSELERFIDTPVKRYSSGMYVRLGFAVAACVRPDILLVDEVLAVGDASFRRKCMKRIQELRDKGTSIILVSHNLYLVQAVCTSALYLENGQIGCQGPTAEVIDAYERAIHEKRARVFDTSHQPEQARHATPIEITQVKVLGVDRSEDSVDEGTKRLDLFSDQPAEVRVHYIAHEPVESANAVIRIIRSDDVTCCMMRTSLAGFELLGLKGTGIVSVVLDPLQLVGGTYFAEARMTDASDSFPMTSGRSKWFGVNGRGLSYEERSGVFEATTRWDHHRKSPVVDIQSRTDSESRLP